MLYVYNSLILRNECIIYLSMRITFLFILCTISYLYLILVILEGKKRRLQIGKGSSYFINTSKQKRGIFGKLKGKQIQYSVHTRYKDLKICVSICHAEENLNKFKEQTIQQTSMVLEVIQKQNGSRNLSKEIIVPYFIRLPKNESKLTKGYSGLEFYFVVRSAIRYILQHCMFPSFTRSQQGR